MSLVPSLLAEVGESLPGIAAERVVLIARAGSSLYGLATPDSDVDYIVVYNEPTEVKLASLRNFPQS